MSLPIIDEETVLDSFAITNNGSRPLGHSTFYGAPSDDNASLRSYSTNSTASNLVGPGRVLGNAYNFAGKRLERTLGDLAHKAGFGPEAVYQQISMLYFFGWKSDDKKDSQAKLQKLCFKLFKHSKSVVDSTRYTAIKRWGDILRDQHEIYVWLFCRQRERMVKYASALLRVIEELQSTTNTLSDSQYHADLSKTSLLVNFHSVGIQFISLGCGELLLEKTGFQVIWNGWSDVSSEEIKEWGVVFQHLLKSLPDPTISELSRWYIDLWTTQIVHGNMHLRIALQSCRVLQCVLEVVNHQEIDRWDALKRLCKEVYIHVVRRFDSDTLLLDEGTHISSTLNDLTQLHDRVFSPKLGSVPNLACLTMLGSTDLISSDIKEKIRDCLKNLKDGEEGPKKKVTETMLLRSCNKLLKRALSELNDTECFDSLSNATSFTDRTRRWAILQLGDILQSLPEIYMLLITLGGDEIRDSMEHLRQSLKVSDTSTSALERCGILMDLRSLLTCHAVCLRLVEDTGELYGWSWDAQNFIKRTAPSYSLSKNYRVNRELFVPHLMDNVTFNPLIFYLKYLVSSHNRGYRRPLISCCIVQGALLTERSVLEENRNAMEELCRTLQNSVIEQLRSTVNTFIGRPIIDSVGHAMRSVYTDLTESRQTFEDEAEVYLSQLCNIYFEFIAKTKHMGYKRGATVELSDFFGSKNILGWFLSIRGPDAEESIARLLEDIDDSNRFDPKEMQYCKGRFSHLEAHKLGVELLAPRYEKLHFEGAGLAKRVSTRSAEPPLTPEQRERWIIAFKTLAANLSSENLDLMKISLFYFANCPLPYETDPMLDTALALDYCENLQLVLSEDNRVESTDKHVKPAVRFREGPWGKQESWNIDESTTKENLSRAVYHIYTCLTKRVECVQQSCMHVTRSVHTIYGTPFDVPKVVKVLNGLAKLCKEKLGADAPELTSIPVC